MRILLASASPRRAELLRAAGFSFDVRPVNIDESVLPGESPQTYVRRLAGEKSAAALARGTAGVSDDRLVVIGADTAVVVGPEIMGKPRDDGDAAGMLRRLSGRQHEVLTGLSVRTVDRELGRVETTEVEFGPLSEADIAWYVGSGEGRDKAGAYAIQGLASRFIPGIIGSYSNVVGLPVALVHELLHQIASGYGSGYPHR